MINSYLGVSSFVHIQLFFLQQLYQTLSKIGYKNPQHFNETERRLTVLTISILLIKANVVTPEHNREEDFKGSREKNEVSSMAKESNINIGHED